MSGLVDNPFVDLYQNDDASNKPIVELKDMKMYYHITPTTVKVDIFTCIISSTLYRWIENKANNSYVTYDVIIRCDSKVNYHRYEYKDYKSSITFGSKFKDKKCTIYSLTTSKPILDKVVAAMTMVIKEYENINNPHPDLNMIGSPSYKLFFGYKFKEDQEVKTCNMNLNEEFMSFIISYLNDHVSNPNKVFHHTLNDVYKSLLEFLKNRKKNVFNFLMLYGEDFNSILSCDWHWYLDPLVEEYKKSLEL